MLRRSYSLEGLALLGVLTGGILLLLLLLLFVVVVVVESEDPVSIWTTCLKEEVSAWTKVVG